ncbi:SurA N-terminal domain-containing protein [Alteromonas antoniana]|uniref:SurA N-terminal domain-containing protein n=1 Tax=Alteromonas antoniana TaxID=2803813 RepID=UPI001C480E29|nr:SurA N-terminal domain-containing protein [Alteromonas antoniana]
MLERIREGSQGPWAMIVIGLIVLSFVFAGVGSYLTSSGSNAAATVNGEEISAQELERAYQNQRQRMESQYGEGIASLFSSESYLQDFRRNVLDRLIAEKLIQQKAAEMGLRVSDKQIREAVATMPEFQFDGKFDNERFKAILGQNGYQVADFLSMMRTQMTQSQLAAALNSSEFALPGEVKRAYDLQQQTRDAKTVLVSAEAFASDITVSDEEIQAYYDENITAFDTDERVNIAYILLNAEDLKADVEVSDEEVQTYYNNNMGAYRTDEERRVSHILIEAGDDADAARQKAEEVLEKVNSGEDFAELAETYSDDTFSAENGGDLDFISPDMMDPAFDEAAFALQNVGDVSDVVESEFGFHIIKLTDIKSEQVTPLAEVESDIRDRLASDKAMERFYELQTAMAEVAFERPDSLDDVAAAVNGTIQETGFYSRNTAPVPLDSANAIDVAFSAELIEDRVNSDIVELSENTVAVMRVREHQPQRTQALEEVKEGIVATVQAEKAQQRAQSWAQDVVASLNEGNDVTAMLDEYDLAWESHDGVTRNGGQLPRGMADALFRLSPESGSNTEVTSLASGDVGIVQLLAVNSGEALADEQRTQLQQQLAQMYSQSMYQTYIDALREQAEVTINPNL